MYDATDLTPNPTPMKKVIKPAKNPSPVQPAQFVKKRDAKVESKLFGKLGSSKLSKEKR